MLQVVTRNGRIAVLGWWIARQLPRNCESTATLKRFQPVSFTGLQVYGLGDALRRKILPRPRIPPMRHARNHPLTMRQIVVAQEELALVIRAQVENVIARFRRNHESGEPQPKGTTGIAGAPSPNRVDSIGLIWKSWRIGQV